LALAAGDATAREYRGIVPLQSTRADVERLIGRPNEEHGYVFDGERVLITYSERKGCEEGLPRGWNVSTDTVLEVAVFFDAEITLGDVLIRGRAFDEIRAVRTQHVFYVDNQEGVRYKTLGGFVEATTYFGSEADDKKLRCAEPRYAAAITADAKNKFEQIPFDSFGKIPFEDAAARLDLFESQLSELNKKESNYRGFIVVYGGRFAYEREAKLFAECSRNYLVTNRQVAEDTLVAVDGGHRDEFVVELFILPNDAYPPRLLPTLGPRRVEILEGDAKACKKQSNAGASPNDEP
jgi:hypothetical protein